MTRAAPPAFLGFCLVCAAPLPLGAAGAAGTAPAAAGFTLEQVKSYPFPNELTAAATGSRIAWASTSAGVRNVYVAEAPGWKARQLTSYDKDDGAGADVAPDSRPTAATSCTCAAATTARTGTTACP